MELILSTSASHLDLWRRYSNKRLLLYNNVKRSFIIAIIASLCLQKMRQIYLIFIIEQMQTNLGRQEKKWKFSKCSTYEFWKLARLLCDLVVFMAFFMCSMLTEYVNIFYYTKKIPMWQNMLTDYVNMEQMKNANVIFQTILCFSSVSNKQGFSERSTKESLYKRSFW